MLDIPLDQLERMAKSMATLPQDAPSNLTRAEVLGILEQLIRTTRQCDDLRLRLETHLRNDSEVVVATRRPSERA